MLYKIIEYTTNREKPLYVVCSYDSDGAFNDYENLFYSEQEAMEYKNKMEAKK